jgi:gamma-glutamyl hydrolase
MQIVNNRPIVGILTQPTSERRHSHRPHHAYLVASYQKFIEMAGGRVVPVPFDAPKEELKKIFNSVNGLLFTGGGLDLKDGEIYFETSKYLWQLMKEANANGDYFPFWGTCQGFQMFHVLTVGASNEYDVVEKYDAWNISWAVNWEKEALKESVMMAEADPVIIHDLGTKDITMNYHNLGIHPDTYEKFPILKEKLRVLATGTDRKNKKFVAMIEGKDLPIFATQFHPEWPIYEWAENANVVHTKEAIYANSYFARFFVGETKKNGHRFDSTDEENEYLIYRWPMNLHYTQQHGDTQTYYWKQ